MAALRAQVQGMEQALAGAEGRSGDVAQLITRVDALESGSGAAVGNDLKGQIEGIKAANADLQSAWTRSSSARAQVQDLATRVDQLEAAVAAAGGSGGEAVTRPLAELETKLGDLSATVARLEQAAAGDRPELGGLTSRVGALEARLGKPRRARRSRAWPAASAR